MKILGITGSSGSGKTTISGMFSKFENVVVFDSDKIIKELDYPKSKYLEEIKKYFGEDILLEDGYLNRKKLSQIIYYNEKSRIKLNEITKKYFLPKMLELIENNKNKKLIVFDIPILFENKLEQYCDYILSIISDKNIQIERICLRDNIDENKALKRLENQLSNEFFINNSDFIIYNNKKTKEELEKEINKIYLKIVKE